MGDSAAGSRKFDSTYFFWSGWRARFSRVVLVVAVAVTPYELLIFGWLSSGARAWRFDYNFFIGVVGQPDFPWWCWWWLWPFS
jgi:hypothetical protein